MNQLIFIDNTQIKQDSQLRYCLNDLHKASGGNPIHAPAQFLRNKSVVDFISALTDMQICTSPVNAIRGGIEQGTYVCEELVYKYAGWINAEFDVKVHSIFKSFVNGKFNHKSTPALPDFTNPAEAARAWAEQYENRAIAEQKLIQAQPKIEFVNRYVANTGLRTITEVSKILKVKRKDLIESLICDKALYRQNGALLPYQDKLERGYFDVKTGSANDAYNYSQTLVTGLGVEWIAKRYASELM